nr:unknown [uncultured bacterium]
MAQRATPAARPAPAPQQAAPAAAAARSVSVAGYVPRTVSFNTSREGSAE